MQSMTENIQVVLFNNDKFYFQWRGGIYPKTQQRGPTKYTNDKRKTD